jgi:hypothetical protein
MTVPQNINSVFPLRDSDMEPIIDKVITVVNTTSPTGTITVSLREPETVDNAFAFPLSATSVSGAPIMVSVTGVSGNTITLLLTNLLTGQPITSSSAYSGTTIGVIAFRYRR